MRFRKVTNVWCSGIVFKFVLRVMLILGGRDKPKVSKLRRTIRNRVKLPFFIKLDCFLR